MKLTKEHIDKVRHIEGFPQGRDEDIIALSDPPYYTACPNPFIEDFIREHGTPYDEKTDDYHREPFAADVSEGKNDPIYNAHSYHTKVPHKAIMRYILHYTNPGDIVLDGFCGTGMTGVAAQMCANPDPAFKQQLELEMPGIQWGERKAVLNDLSPAATFITYNYNTKTDVHDFEQEAKRILTECEKELGWMYETQHIENGKPVFNIEGEPVKGRINYTVWSDVLVCPSCGRDIIFWDVAIDKMSAKMLDPFSCNNCNSRLRKTDCFRAQESRFDDRLNQTVTMAKQLPVLINYSIGKKRYEKFPDSEDFELIEKINNSKFTYWHPTDELPAGFNTEQPKRSHGIEHVHQLYTKRNYTVLACVWEKANQYGGSKLLAWCTSAMTRTSKMYKYMPTISGGRLTDRRTGTVSGTLYVPSMSDENTPFDLLRSKIRDFKFSMNDQAIISTQSLSDVPNIPEQSIDYIFTDPPFGANLNYSELSFLWEAWLKVITNQKPEAIMNNVQGKGLVEYQNLMTRCFIEYYRVLKPGRWMTVEFHNSKNAVWNAIQESLQRAGFVVADVRTLDKQQGSFKQVTSTAAVKQDLVISAYKPRAGFVKEFVSKAGDPEMAWAFVSQHLENLPVLVDGDQDGVLDLVSERRDYLLFDRMVAYHIMHGVSVPMDAHAFYAGLRQRFLERDGMFFLPDQVSQYDEKRLHMDLDTTQYSFVVTDEKNAIQWLNYILKDKPQTYSDIYTQFTRELVQDKREKMPELMDMLEENFLKDEKGRYYIPDLSDAADLAKLRTKKLVKEFYDSYVPGKAKLKVFRMEAIRAGFDDCWNKRDYKTIIQVGERLPEAVLQEDPALLMYYDNACVRS